VILEIATLDIQPGREEDFEAGVRQATPLFLRSRGCRGLTLQHVIEEPSRYLLIVRWDTLEDHTVHFRGSEDFQAWRGLVGPFFAAPPSVVHAQAVVEAPPPA
jgi:heme-degrading monooxygenase HmoA